MQLSGKHRKRILSNADRSSYTLRFKSNSERGIESNTFKKASQCKPKGYMERKRKIEKGYEKTFVKKWKKKKGNFTTRKITFKI